MTGCAGLLASGYELSVAESAFGQSPTLPADVQVGLITKLVRYDRNFLDRVGAVVKVVVLVEPKSTRSRIAAEAFKAALSSVDRVAGLRHEVRMLNYNNASSLAKLCRTERLAIVYVTPDFDAEIGALQRALVGVDVLTVSAVPEYVPLGLVLGFELVSGKPKILVNLPRAKQQNVDFSASVLRLMKVYQ